MTFYSNSIDNDRIKQIISDRDEALVRNEHLLILSKEKDKIIKNLENKLHQSEYPSLDVIEHSIQAKAWMPLLRAQIRQLEYKLMCWESWADSYGTE